MPLINFGSILGFAINIEEQNLQFFSDAAQSPSCSEYKSLFDTLIKGCNKHIKELNRARRENVTEMILESIEGFTREPFILEIKDAAHLDKEEVLGTIRDVIERAIRYYTEASVKLKGQAEVSRTLKTLGKKYKRLLAEF